MRKYQQKQLKEFKIILLDSLGIKDGKDVADSAIFCHKLCSNV